ncbi:MAG: hypothetical protein AAF376_18485 [Pseudomonadota bacterium]
METDLALGPWQDLPEMDWESDNRVAGIEAALALIAIWHFHAAAKASQAKLTDIAVARCRAALAADGHRQTARDILAGRAV